MDNIVLWLFLVSIIIIYITKNKLFTSSSFWWKHNDHENGVLPLGSIGWPFIGETIDFILCAYTHHPETFTDKRRAMYGKVFKSHIFGTSTIVSTDAEVSKIVLQSDSKAFVPYYPKSVLELMGKSSILLMNGSLHRRFHGLVGSFFKSASIKAQITRDMERYIQKSMDGWREDEPIYLQDETKNIAFQVLVKTLIGLDPGEEMNILRKQFQEFISGLVSLPIKLPGSQLYKSLQAKKKVISLVEKITKSKRSYNKNNNDDFSSEIVRKDLVGVLVNEELSDEVIVDNIIVLMIPGEDSVPLLITLAVKFLSHSPDALRQLTKENMELKRLKAKLGEPFCWNDYLSLPFTQKVITETLRLGNIVTGVMRKAVKDVRVKGYLIPKGWCFFAYFRSLHLDDNHYDSPYNFNPSRWQNKDISNSNFTPFGGGQRLCAGLDLARLEASIFLHSFVTKFRWVTEEDSIVNFPTVRMKRRMPVWVEKIGD